ncbi:MAG: poly-gamma-glutamate synthase PgsB [Myxococcales bacterium]|nr:poly-gamma-glutamate synthase PgsB [Myxococcales bacterium]
MTAGLFLLVAATVGLVGFLIIESIQHRRALAGISVRIHVNGTRGKSSVTRLIASGLRAGGIRVCAKTTGTLPRMIFPDGKEFPVFRPARPNVLEQLRIIRMAADLKADVLVIECMAVQPLLQVLCEERMVRATHGVITNARPDHLDVMGPTDVDVARALSGTTPVGGKMFTAERKLLPVLREAADDRHTQLVSISADDVSMISKEDLTPFPYLEHAENVALALAVCEELGVERQTALQGMWSAAPDPGVLTVNHIHFFGRRITFVNAFAANDPDSTETIWDQVLSDHPSVEHRIMLVNCRADRGDRSRQLGQACVNWREADRYVLIGSGTYLFAQEAVAQGLDPSRLTYAEDRRIEEIFEIILEDIGRSALVVGIANIGGQGLDLVRFFKNRAQLEVGKNVQ